MKIKILTSCRSISLLLGTYFAFVGCDPTGSGSSKVIRQAGAADPSQSTLTISHSTVDSGSSVRASIRLLDEGGMTVTQDTSVSFSISDGTSTGIFGNSAKRSDGTYDVEFVGVKSGSAVTVNATVDSFPLTSALPTVTVVPGKLSLLTSTLTLGSSQLLAGTSTFATFIAKDDNGNLLTSGGAKLELSTDGVGSSGQFGAVQDHGDGTYTIPFLGTKVGAVSKVTATVDGVPLLSAMPSFQVALDRSLFSLSNTVASLSSGSVLVGEPVSVSTIVKDPYGNVLGSGLPVTFTVSPPILGQSPFTPVTYSDETGYGTTFTSTLSGTYAIQALVNGSPLQGAPLIVVVPGALSLAQSTVSLASSAVQAGQSVVATVIPKDIYGNAIGTGLGVTFALLPNITGGNFGAVTYAGDGRYTSTFTAATTGTYSVQAFVGGGLVSSSTPQITVNLGTPSLAQSIVAATSPLVVASVPVQVTLLAKDVVGNILGSGLNVSFSSTPAGGTFSNAVYSGNGIYTANFTSAVSGVYSIRGLMDGNQLTSAASAVTVTSGAASTLLSTVTTSSPNVTAGGSVTVTLQAKDANGAPLGSGLPISFNTLPGPVNAGTFTDVVYLGNGNYSATFTGMIAGTYTVVGMIAGNAVTSPSPQLVINAGPASVAQSVSSASASTLASGYHVDVFVQAKDVAGNILGSGVDVSFVSVPPGVGTFGPVTYVGNGMYKSTLTAQNPGSYTIAGVIGGSILTTPGTLISVTSGVPSPSESILSASSTTLVAGGTVSVTLQAKDSSGNVLGGGLPITFSTVPASAGTFTNITYTGNGNYTATFTGNTAGVFTIQGAVSGTVVTSTSPQITISPASATQFVLAALTNKIAGESFSLILQAKDANGNIATGYTGTVHFTSTDSAALLPADYTFSSSDNGAHTFSGVAFKTTGSKTLSVADTSTSGLTVTSSNVTVGAAAFSLAQSTIACSASTVGSTASLVACPGSTSFSSSLVLTLTAKDIFGNANPSGINSVAFTLAAGGVGTGSFGAVTSIGNGVYTSNFSGGVAGSVSLGAKINGSALSSLISATVQSTAATHFIFSGIPASPVAGTPFNLTLQAKDANGNTATGYRGTVHFTSTDLQVSLPADYTFQSIDNGIHVFTGIALKTSGSNSVTVTDASDSALTVTSSTTVLPGTFSLVQSTLSNSLTSAGGIGSGLSVKVTLTAKDAYGNSNPNGITAVVFSTLGLVGGTGTFGTVTGSNGVYTANFLGVVTGLVTVGASINGSAIVATTSINVLPGNASQLVMSSLSSPSVAGSSFGVTIAAKDASGNTVSGYTGTIRFTSTDNQAVLPADYTFKSSDNGSHTFAGLALKTIGEKSISVIDTSTSALTANSGTVTVTPGAFSLAQSTVTGSTSVVAGASITVTLTAKDAFGNSNPSGITAVTFSSSGSGGSGSFGPVTSAGNGIYTSVFTGSTSGSISLGASVNGAALATNLAVTVQPGSASQMVLSSITSPVVAGSVIGVTVQVKDANSNIVTGYTGTVRFTSTDSHASLPADYTFVASDNGSRAFTGLTFKTVGTRTVTVKDTASSTLTATSGSITVNAGAFSLAQSTVTGASTVASGGSISVTLTAKDAFGNANPSGITAAAFTSSVTGGTGSFGTVTSSGNGVYTASFTGSTAGTVTLGATLNGSAVTGGLSVTVQPGNASQMVLSTFTNPVVAGTAMSATLQVKDAAGNAVPSYTGTVRFTSSDSQAVLPANYTFVSSDNGSRTFTGAITLKSAGSRTVTVNDLSQASLTVTGTTTVAPAAFSLAQSAVTTIGSFVSGAPITVTLTAKDAFGNSNPSGITTVAFTSSSTGGTGTFGSVTSAGNGVYTASFTPAVSGLVTLGATINGSTVSGGATATVYPGNASQMILSNISTPSVAGSTFGVTVQIKDASGNAATGYTGTVRFTSTDTQAVLPANYTFLSSDAGTRTFTGLSLKTSGARAITATDTVTPSLTVTSNAVTVNSGAFSLSQTTLTGSSAVTSGAVITLTLTPRDEFGNLSPSGITAIAFNSSGTGGGSFGTMANTNGVYTVPFTAGAAGSVTLGATINGNALSAGLPITVQAGSTSQITLSSISSTNVAGTSFGLTVQARDAAGNPVTGYTGTVRFTSTDTQAVLPANYTFVSADAGVKSFTGFVLKTVGNRTITVTDVNTSSIAVTSAIVAVTAGAFSLTQSVITNAATVSAGTSIPVTLTVKDAFGNANPSGVTSVAFTASATGGSGTFGAITSVGSGVYTANFAASTVGSVTLGARLNNTAMTGGTSVVTVTASAMSPTNSTLTLSSSSVKYNLSTPITATLVVKDQFGNTIPTGGSTVVISQGNISQSDAGSVVIDNTGNDKGNGTYISTVLPAMPGTVTLAVTVNGQPFAVTSPTLTIGGVNLETPIEMIDTGLTAKRTTKIFEISRTNLNPVDYDGTVTYSFEIVASTSYIYSWNVELVDSSNNVKATIVVPAGTTSRRYRTAFTPNSAADQYRIKLSANGLLYLFNDPVYLSTARILVKQVNATRTKVYYPLLSGAYNKYYNSDSSAVDMVSSTSYTRGVDTNYPLWYKNSDQLVNLASGTPWSLDAVLWTQADNYDDSTDWSDDDWNGHNWNTNQGDAAQVCSVSLFKFVNGSGSQVSGSEVTTGGLTPADADDPHLLSTAFADNASNFTNNNIFGLRMKSSISGKNCFLAKAGIWARISLLSKAEVVYRVERQYLNISSSVNTGGGRTVLDLSQFNGSAVSVSYEASGTASSTSNMALSLLSAGTSDNSTSASAVSGCSIAGSGGTAFQTWVRTGACSGIVNGNRYINGFSRTSGSISSSSSNAIVNFQY